MHETITKHTEELHNLHFSSNTIRVIKSRRMRWAVHEARMGELRISYNILVGNLERRVHLEDLDVDGRLLLE